MLIDNNSEILEQSEQGGKPSLLGPKVTNALYVAYGVVVLLLSAFQLLREAYSIASLEGRLEIISYIYKMSCTYLYAPVIGMLVAYGLIARKGWARYGVIAAMLTLPVTLPLLLMVYGPFLTPVEISVQSVLAILIIVFFIRFPLPKDSATKFRMKSLAGLLVLAMLVLSVRPLFTPLYLKYKSGEPLFVSEAKTIAIDPDKYQPGYVEQRKIETPTVSFYVPYGYHVVSAEGDGNSWGMMLLNDREDESGIISVGTDRPGDGLFNTKEFERMGITNGLAFYRFMYTNNWNPGAIMLRFMGMRGAYEFNEFTLGEHRGFLKAVNEEKRDFHGFGLYEKDGRLILAGEVNYDGNNQDSGERLSESIISSVEVSPPKRIAEDHYKSGLDLYDRGDMVAAQFAFAQAYFQKPDSPEYAYMLVKSLMTEKHHFYSSMERMLEGSLKANPGNEKLKKLLEEIKAKEKEEG